VAKACVKKEEARCLRTADPLPNFLKILAVKLHQVAEGLETSDPRWRGCLAAVGLAFSFQSPASGIIAT
jgi:hypothetical protein